MARRHCYVACAWLRIRKPRLRPATDEWNSLWSPLQLQELLPQDEGPRAPSHDDMNPFGRPRLSGEPLVDPFVLLP